MNNKKNQFNQYLYELRFCFNDCNASFFKKLS